MLPYKFAMCRGAVQKWGANSYASGCNEVMVIPLSFLWQSFL